MQRRDGRRFPKCETAPYKREPLTISKEEEVPKYISLKKARIPWLPYPQPLSTIGSREPEVASFCVGPGTAQLYATGR